jgi:hypothetical protein
MSNHLLILVAAFSLVAGCSAPSSPEAGNRADAAPSNGPLENAAAVPPDNEVAEAPLDPPDPGEPGGLPDDRTPISEAPFTETSAQGAANVVQTYQGLLEAGRYGEAWRLWADDGRASGMSEADFAASFRRYREYHARVGAPGEIEGAAGSLYVEVPVQVYGRLGDGRPFNMLGPMTLRRVNDVPGSTPEQRRWHIAESGIRPRP